MLQNTRTRLVAPGLTLPAGLEALVLGPWNERHAETERRPGATRPEADTTVNAWVPAVDVEEREAGLHLAIEVPGVAPEALTVTVDDGVLTVSGERPFGRPERGPADDGRLDGGRVDGGRVGGGRVAYRLERRFGRFSRSLTLPRTVDPDRIAARYEHGVLYLEVPKRPEARPRRIAVATTAVADARQVEGGPVTA